MGRPSFRGRPSWWIALDPSEKHPLSSPPSRRRKRLRATVSRRKDRMATSPSLPLISVVVPSFNQAQFLPEALESIFRQNYPRLEVVVMDGGSTDDSVAIIESYADRLAYWPSPHHR